MIVSSKFKKQKTGLLSCSPNLLFKTGVV